MTHSNDEFIGACDIDIDQLGIEEEVEVILPLIHEGEQVGEAEHINPGVHPHYVRLNITHAERAKLLREMLERGHRGISCGYRAIIMDPEECEVRLVDFDSIPPEPSLEPFLAADTQERLARMSRALQTSFNHFGLTVGEVNQGLTEFSRQIDRANHIAHQKIRQLYGPEVCTRCTYYNGGGFNDPDGISCAVHPHGPKDGECLDATH